MKVWRVNCRHGARGTDATAALLVSLFVLLGAAPAEAATFQDASQLLGPLVPDFTYGSTWVDLDNDGWPDLFLTNHNQRPPYVLRNEGGTSFQDVSAASGMAYETDYHTCKWGDYDRDGDWDVFCTTGAVNGNGSRPDRFYRNRGDGTFVDIAAQTNTAFDQGRGRTVSWLDMDSDGDLDLYVGTLVEQSGDPPAKLFRNDGSTFSDVTTSSGIALNGTVQSAVVLDFDQDNDPDLLLSFLGASGQTVPCSACLLFLRNGGSGTFTVQKAGPFGLNGNKAWALAVGDFDNDGDLDVFQGNGWSAALHRNDQQTFTSLSLASVGLSSVTAWRIEDAAWADFNNDGFLDLYVVRNDPDDVTNPPDALYLNNGNSTFRDGTTEFGAAGSSLGNGDSVAIADFDGNGFIDVLIANGEGNAHGGYQLLRNAGNANNWLRLLPTNAQGSPEFGAKVYVFAGNQLQYREFGDTANKVSHEPVLHFGLGSRGSADLVRVRWPDGSTTELSNVATNQTLEIQKASGGPTSVPVPDVVGLTQAAAESAITGAGLVVGAVTTASSETVAAGHVISQNPTAGSSVASGSGVALIVSIGPGTDGLFLNFDGANDRVVVPSTSSLRLTRAVTVEAWIKPDSVSNITALDRVVRKGSNYELTVSTGDTGCAGGTGGHVQWAATIGGANIRICGGSLALGKWHHLTGTFDGSVFALYVNGILAASTSRSGLMTVSKHNLVIGNNDSGQRGFDGGIDSVAVWNRALSASEIRDRVTQALAGSESGLAAYWSFNEPSGQTVFDATANANHGTLGSKSTADAADPFRQATPLP